jgi:hypothetical protein
MRYMHGRRISAELLGGRRDNTADLAGAHADSLASDGVDGPNLDLVGVGLGHVGDGVLAVGPQVRDEVALGGVFACGALAAAAAAEFTRGARFFARAMRALAFGAISAGPWLFSAFSALEAVQPLKVSLRIPPLAARSPPEGTTASSSGPAAPRRPPRPAAPTPAPTTAALRRSLDSTRTLASGGGRMAARKMAAYWATTSTSTASSTSQRRSGGGRTSRAMRGRSGAEWGMAEFFRHTVCFRVYCAGDRLDA